MLRIRKEPFLFYVNWRSFRVDRSILKWINWFWTSNNPYPLYYASTLFHSELFMYHKYRKHTRIMHIVYINIVAQPSTGQSSCGTWILLSESCYLFSDFVATWGEAIVRISLIETCWKQMMNSHIYCFIDYICFHCVSTELFKFICKCTLMQKGDKNNQYDIENFWVII